MLKIADKKLRKAGLYVSIESNDLIRYMSFPGKESLDRRVTITKDEDGVAVVNSFDNNLFDFKGVGNTSVGLTSYEMKWLIRKIKEKGWN